MMTVRTTTVDPRAHDEATAKICADWTQAERRLSDHIDTMHRMAGDVKSYTGRQRLWNMSLAQVHELLTGLPVAEEQVILLRYHMTPAQAFEREAQLRHESATLGEEYARMERIYNDRRWTRFFPCTNRDGHIHRSLRDCSTVLWDTPMAWRPDLSGVTTAEAVAELGEALCSVCFPAAPSNWKAKTLGQVADERTRAEREAAKAARDAVKNAKRLAPGEVFRTRYGSDLVETVALCKELLRRPVEEAASLAWHKDPKTVWRGPEGGLERLVRNLTENLARMEEDAAQATKILLAREAAHEGWGATQSQINRILLNAARKARREWA